MFPPFGRKETISVEYTEWGEWRYFATFVLSLGYRGLPTDTGDVFVNRIWAEDEIIYSRESGFSKAGLDFTFFPGTSDQGEVRRGMHYRDQMCVLFNDFDVTDYGNGIPSISVELIDGTPGAPASIPLSAAVETLTRRAGYATDAIDVTDLAGLTFHGYILSSGGLANALDDLSNVYGFNYTERAGEVVFSYRYADGELIIDGVAEERELATLSERTENPQIIVASRAPDERLPSKMAISYFNMGDSYKPATQEVKRTKHPHPTHFSEQTLSLPIPVTMGSAEAKSRLLAAMQRLWAAKGSYSLRLPPAFIRFDPGNTLEFTAYEITYQALIIDTIINADNSVTVVLSDTAADNYPIDAPVQEPIRPPELVQGSPAFALVMDLPALTPGEVEPGLLTNRVALAEVEPGSWQGARFDVRKSDTAQWVPQFATEETAYIGELVSTVLEITSPFETDEINSLLIDPGNIPVAMFQPATYAEMLEGANLIVVGRGGFFEYLQYGGVQFIDGLVRLTSLFRGRYGTDTYVNMHSVGDYVVMLDNLELTEYPVSEFQAVAKYFYRAYSAGGRTSPPAFYAPMGNSRKPHAPNDVRAKLEDNGDITVTWQRRVRFGGELQDGTGALPLDEIEEFYSLDIYNADFDAVVRRVTNLEAPAYTYTVADQILDGLDVSEGVNVTVFQLNPTHVGRGFPGGGALLFDVPEMAPAVTFAAYAEIGASAGAALTVTGLPWVADATVTVTATAALTVGMIFAAHAEIGVEVGANLTVPSDETFSGIMLTMSSGGASSNVTTVQGIPNLNVELYNVGGWEVAPGGGGVVVPEGVTAVEITAGVALTASSGAMGYNILTTGTREIFRQPNTSGFTSNVFYLHKERVEVDPGEIIELRWQKNATNLRAPLLSPNTFLAVKKVE